MQRIITRFLKIKLMEKLTDEKMFNYLKFYQLIYLTIVKIYIILSNFLYYEICSPSLKNPPTDATVYMFLNHNTHFLP